MSKDTQNCTHEYFSVGIYSFTIRDFEQPIQKALACIACRFCGEFRTELIKCKQSER